MIFGRVDRHDQTVTLMHTIESWRQIDRAYVRPGILQAIERSARDLPD